MAEHLQQFIFTFFGASLIDLEKKGGGARPIAVGHILGRLAAKCLCSWVVALPRECRLMHMLPDYLSKTLWITTAFFKNAFNSLQ